MSHMGNRPTNADACTRMESEIMAETEAEWGAALAQPTRVQGGGAGAPWITGFPWLKEHKREIR